MKIAYIGDFINHGKSLQTTGTPIVILLSLLDSVDSIDVFCPEENEITEEFELPSKVRLLEFYRYNNSKSIIRLLKVQWRNYDVVIFNMLPTGVGDGTIANASALIVPILLVKLFRQNNINIIYHNSVFTNNVQMLGYDSAFDKIRSFFLGIVEKILFKSVNTFVLLDLYKHRIDNILSKNRVQVLKSRYLESITTLYINKVMDYESLKIEKSEILTVLLHGSWGPQKNIELSLLALRNIRESGIKFRLRVSGGINHHFPEYERKFQELLNSYSDVIDEYLGPISEKDIIQIFLGANLLILPYNSPGGHSGVLEQAIFFGVSTIVMDFPEYREQAKGISNVKFVTIDNFYSELVNCLEFLEDTKKININDKITSALANIKQLLAASTEKW